MWSSHIRRVAHRLCGLLLWSMYMCVCVGSGVSYLPLANNGLFVFSESSIILPRALADIEVFLVLGVLIVVRWEGAVSPIRFGTWASSRIMW